VDVNSDRSAERGEPHVLIIGGGIAGLAAAHRIRGLDSACRITIVDAAARLGGKIAGEMVDGCVVDGGADVCIGDKLRATRLFGSLDLESRILRVNPNRLPTFERRGGRLQLAPTTFTSELVTFTRGMQEIVDAAWTGLDDVNVETSTAIQVLEAETSGWRATTIAGRSFLADSVIVATPPGAAAELLASTAPQHTAWLRSLKHPPTTTVTMAWHATDIGHALDGTGYLVPDPDARVSACTWTSSKNPTHAANGVALLRGYIRGTGNDAAALMSAEVADTLDITAPPIFTRVYEWSSGLPIYPPEHDANVRALGEQLASTPGIFVAGSAFHGVGIPDCITSGERAAAAALAHVRSTSARA
jgi:oxygen-dependent protoporphyrinogen oxidase